MNRVIRGLLMIMVGTGATSPVLYAKQPDAKPGAVFVMTNAATKNEIIAFERSANGSLAETERYDTHGRGNSGATDPLGSQGSLTKIMCHLTHTPYT